jgi:hypothetical protein
MCVQIFEFITNDRFGFWLFEGLFFVIFLCAFYKDKIWPERSIVSKVIREEKSRRLIIASASAFTVFAISVLFTITSYPKEKRVLLYLINLGIVIYLFFYSGWFTNKLIGWWMKFEQRNFSPHGQ